MRYQDGRGDLLSLCISISRGEETYEDSPSNGERTGNCPAWKSGCYAARIVVWRSILSDGPGPSLLEWGAREGESPVKPEPYRNTRFCQRVRLFGNAALIGDKFHPRLNNGERSIVNKYREGRMKRTLKRESKIA
ncbi:hypothetical protein KSP40_PGU006164 [Platanthera guangdongensis]|uniref:Uncharacterized protein n=1 Tax=Platanthera guangdongensis TaxID=2320717 RepID=A0ABR2LZ85_9ASPA